jgi:DNA-binding transcriptional LysR family regulator
MRKDPLPPLDALRAFEVAAAELSFTRAAERLFVTQSAISKQIHLLEEHLGVPLFERRHRALALTGHGATLLRATADAFARLRDAATQIAQGEEPAINVTTTPALASLWLIPRLGGFFRENPGIDVRISADTRVVDLQKSPYDVALRYLRDDDAPRNAPRLFGETVLPVCSPKLLGDPQRPLKTPEDLRFHTLLDYHDEQRLRPWLGWPMLLEALGVGGLRPAATIAFNHYDQLLRAAIDGHGIAVGSLGLLREPLADGRLQAPFAQRLTTPRGYYVLPAAEARERPAVRRFCDWLRSQAEVDTASPSDVSD